MSCKEYKRRNRLIDNDCCPLWGANLCLWCDKKIKWYDMIAKCEFCELWLILPRNEREIDLLKAASGLYDESIESRHFSKEEIARCLPYVRQENFFGKKSDYYSEELHGKNLNEMKGPYFKYFGWYMTDGKNKNPKENKPTASEKNKTL